MRWALSGLRRAKAAGQHAVQPANGGARCNAQRQGDPRREQQRIHDTHRTEAGSESVSATELGSATGPTSRPPPERRHSKPLRNCCATDRAGSQRSANRELLSRRGRADCRLRHGDGDQQDDITAQAMPNTPDGKIASRLLHCNDLHPGRR